jgi:F-type H+-transporting ATPase subunit c
MKLVKTAALALVSLAMMQAQAMAQEVGTPVGTAGNAVVRYPFSDLRALAVGLVIMGAAAGIGGLTKAAVESMARQPETAANIQTAMIISAALIEGVTFFALIIIGFILAG